MSKNENYQYVRNSEEGSQFLIKESKDLVVNFQQKDSFLKVYNGYLSETKTNNIFTSKTPGVVHKTKQIIITNCSRSQEVKLKTKYKY